MINKNNLQEYFKVCDSSRCFDRLGIMFYNIYKTYANYYKIYIDNDGEVQTFEGLNYFTDIEKKLKNHIDLKYFIKKVSEKLEVDVMCIDDDEYLILGDTYDFMLHLFVSTTSEKDSDPYFDLFCKSEDVNNIKNLIKNCFRPMDKTQSYGFGIATYNANTLYTSNYNYIPKDIDIEKNYNDDFQEPYKKICNIIEQKNETGLILLYGEPGTGKSSVIKNLISTYPELEFVFVDGTMLANVPSNVLVSYFIENENTVFILEDCEKVLMSREEGFNPVINTLLNITDGIIGDVLGIKLICTFNTKLSKIDKALLRKGRLSLKYEFKKLKSDKVSKILGREITEDMSLADIYNIDEENDFSKNKESSKIGFNR